MDCLHCTFDISRLVNFSWTKTTQPTETQVPDLSLVYTRCNLTHAAEGLLSRALALCKGDPMRLLGFFIMP
jgi:hypothetical protein